MMGEGIPSLGKTTEADALRVSLTAISSDNVEQIKTDDDHERHAKQPQSNSAHDLAP